METTSQAKTAIIIVIYNVDLFIVKQIECIKRFCKDEHQIIIIDNSTIPEVSEAIKYRIREIDCIYKKTQANSGDPSLSHSFAANFAYWKYKDSYSLVFFLDHDAFPIKDFSVKEILGDKVIAGMAQTKPSGKTYIWAGCLMLNNGVVEKELVDLSPNSEYGLDTGGNTYKIIDKYGLENCVFFNEHYHENVHFKIPHYNFYSIIHDGVFMHFIAGSNWQKTNENEHAERISTLMVCLGEEITKGNPI